MAGGCMIAVTLDNGAICKSIHGGLKREPGSINYEVYGMKGMMESDRFDGGRLNVYREGEKLCIGDWEKYETKPFIAPELLEKSVSMATAAAISIPPISSLRRFLAAPTATPTASTFTRRWIWGSAESWRTAPS